MKARVKIENGAVYIQGVAFVLPLRFLWTVGETKKDAGQRQAVMREMCVRICTRLNGRN